MLILSLVFKFIIYFIKDTVSGGRIVWVYDELNFKIVFAIELKSKSRFGTLRIYQTKSTIPDLVTTDLSTESLSSRKLTTEKLMKEHSSKNSKVTLVFNYYAINLLLFFIPIYFKVENDY